MAKRRKSRRKPKGLPRGVYTRLAQMSKATVARRRKAAYTQMGEALIHAGVLEWGTDEPLPATASGLEKATWQAERMSLEAWSRSLGEGLRAKRFTLHRGKWYRRKPDGTRGPAVRRLGLRKMRMRQGQLVDVNAPGARVDRSIRQAAHAARVRMVQQITGSSYAEARKSYSAERDEWDKTLAETEEGESPGLALAVEDEEVLPLPLEAQIKIAGFQDAEERYYRRATAR